jgi:predicted HTH transcriptional regulator
LCEERGTGFQKVIKSLEPSGAPPLLGDSYPPVAFRTHHETFRVILYREKPFSELTLDERVEACFQHAVLKHASSAVLTNTTLRERFRLSARKGNDVTNTIGEAVKRGRIKRVNPGEGPKSAKYVPYWA